MKHSMIYNIYHVRMYMCMHLQLANNNKNFSSLEGLNIRVNIKQKCSNSEKSFVIFLFQHYYSRDNRDSASQMSVWIQGSRLLLQCLLVINEMDKQRCNSWEMFVRCCRDEDKTHKHEFPRSVRKSDRNVTLEFASAELWLWEITFFFARCSISIILPVH